MVMKNLIAIYLIHIIITNICRRIKHEYVYTELVEKKAVYFMYHNAHDHV